MVMTPADHMTARQGEVEEEKRRELMPPFQQGRSAATVAAVKILASSSSKVQPLTMMKPILIQKIFSGKRGEVWVCDKAGRVTASGKVVHGDRCFIGEFRVGRVQRFQSVRSALEWFGHKLFLPGSPSLESTLLFYYKLFTGQQPVMSEALVWDQEEGRTFRTWRTQMKNSTLSMMTETHHGHTHRNKHASSKKVAARR
jgi:ASC-1-like (ASCH) protein